jgi:hypothetical protein
MTSEHELLERLRDEASARVYVACTGAGAGLAQRLWAVPGASSFLVGASFPYATEAVDAFLGFTPDRYCSEETALDLATAAYLAAAPGEDVIGVGLTASVASLNPHRGPHRIYAASLGRRGARLYAALLDRDSGAKARARDGSRADALGLVALLDGAGLPSASVAAAAGEFTMVPADERARARFFQRPLVRSTGDREAAPARLRLAFPGTFDPPHEGHLGMADAARELTGIDPVLWISAEPPHKPAVPLTELLSRTRLLRGKNTLFSRGEPLYIDKARRYPGAGFVLGTDALVRLLDPRWGVAPEALVAEFRSLGTRFYVASRAVDGELVTLRDVPEAARDLCTELPGRWDVSSTHLRSQRTKA